MNQLDIFSIGCEPLKITKPIRLIELFAGIGSQAKALESLGVSFEHHRVCEFDPYAITSYNAIHNTNFEPSDITDWKGNDLGITDTAKFIYLLTYSFPCQSLSIAGHQEGMVEGSGTTSSLLWEVKRLLEETENLPQVLVMENVPEVLSTKNRDEFFRWIEFLNQKGYSSKYEILNAKDYKVPQNRERCFMVSWLGDYFYCFPNPQPLTKVLKDVLQREEEIDEKYYISEKGVKYVLQREGTYTQLLDEDSKFCPVAITAVGNANWTGNFIKCEHIAQLEGSFEMANRVYSVDGLCPTIRTFQGGNLEPKIMTENPQIEVVGNYSPSGHDASRIVSADGLAPTVKENHGIVTAIRVIDHYNHKEISSNVVGTVTTKKSPIRKLTQKECWRLMDFDDEDYEKARKALNDKFYKGKDRSGSQLYKQAGNSIVVSVLEAIFKEMF